MEITATTISTRPGGSSNSDTGVASLRPVPSQFDQVRSKLASMAGAKGVEATSSTNTAADPQQKKPVDPVRSGNAVISPDAIASVPANLAASRQQLDTLKGRVASASNVSSIGPAGSRLMAVEAQYKQLEAEVRNISYPADPQKLLQLQQNLYQLNESLGIITKMVDQVTAGTKSVLQIQV